MPYLILHSYAMDGTQFLQALLDLRGLNPNSMAKKAGNHALQSTVARFLGGNQSRRSTMQPVADFFGVDVGGFYDPDKAVMELRRLGAMEGQMHPGPAPISMENNPDYPAIRRVHFKLSAGASGFGVDYEGEDAAPIVFRREWYERNGYQPGKLLAVRVSNGSMEPGLYDGDTVVVNTADTTPADGAMTSGSPERFSATFPHPMVLKTVTLSAEGQEPIVVTAPAAPAAAAVSVALPRLSPGTYTAAWTAEGPDGHKMSGSIRFMVH